MVSDNDSYPTEVIINDWAELSKGFVCLLSYNRSAMYKIILCIREMKYSVYELVLKHDNL